MATMKSSKKEKAERRKMRQIRIQNQLVLHGLQAAGDTQWRIDDLERALVKQGIGPKTIEKLLREVKEHNLKARSFKMVCSDAQLKKPLRKVELFAKNIGKPFKEVEIPKHLQKKK